MYYVVMEGHNYYYEVYEMLSLYFPSEKVSTCSIENLPSECNYLMSVITKDCNTALASCVVGFTKDSQRFEVCSTHRSFEVDDGSKSDRESIKLTVFEALRKLTGVEMPWGVLVGIRPSKIVSEMLDKNRSMEDISRILREKYLVRDDRIALLKEVSKNSYSLINNDPKKISVYIGIPFCPTRCLYCSFASYPINKQGSLVQDYLDSLVREMELLSPFIKDHFCVESLYIGGGTPTSIGDDDFKNLLYHAKECFATDNLREFTVEAGRPDTIDRCKLETMKSYGVTRTSINPQTMNDDTLERVGRSHTVDDIMNIFSLARSCGFDNINMDMIIGLPGEGMDHIKRTIEKLLYLSPENITVHSMAVKRASRLKEEIIRDDCYPSISLHDAWSMMDYVQDSLNNALYLPYYMYRQKMMVGNLENVGYCKAGLQCSYNIQEIEEKQTIIGFGADAVTKAVFFKDNRIERFANKKDLKGYIETIDESSNKKLDFLRVLT